MGGKMRMFKSGVLMGAIAIMLAACGQEADRAAADPPPTTTAAAEAPPETPVLMGVYAGVIDCDGCPGIQTRLKLVRNGAHSGEGTYELTETFGDPADISVRTGNWTTLRGDASDPDATVYQLNPDTPEESQFYLKSGEDALILLDRNLARLPGGRGDRLETVEGEPPTS